MEYNAYDALMFYSCYGAHLSPNGDPSFMDRPKDQSAQDFCLDNVENLLKDIKNNRIGDWTYHDVETWAMEAARFALAGI